MKHSEPTDIVLRTMQLLKAEGSWCGETHIQKALYLCQEVMGVPSNFKFVLYKHGPYSFELSAHIQGLIADELVRVISVPSYGPRLEVADGGKTSEEDIRLSFIAKWIGKQGVAYLEKLATAVFVNRKLGTQAPIEERARFLVGLKPHVSMESARLAFVEADKLQSEVSRQAA